MKGRRVETFVEIERPGDYYGPVIHDKPTVFFLKPHARDKGTPPHGRGVQHVTSPPHTFAEEDDGTLTIAPSIGDTRGDGHEGSDGWHGFLERGVWRKV